MSVEQEIKIPDIGGLSGVDVIEVLVKVGDEIHVDTSLITLESDKASMEIPSPVAGIVHALSVKVGDKVSEGDVILTVSVTEQNTAESVSTAATTTSVPDVAPQVQPPVEVEPAVLLDLNHDESEVYAGPSVRRLARVLGLSLSTFQGTGHKGRVTREDIEGFVKQRLQQPIGTMTSAPEIDFSQFGPIETKPLNKIKRLTGQNVHRAWTTIPHVTQFELADITELEAFRKAESGRAAEAGVKLTLLAFVCKVVAHALLKFPMFNSSLDAQGEQLIYKQYCNIGIAVETPNGLVVPVIQDVPRLSVFDIAREMARLSKKAREKGLMPADMRGGCFTISSLGGIGGTAFTPIVNHPEVAILGLSRSSMQPVYQDGVFVPRLMLPLSLSYDHRVIDGAEGARFARFISEQLGDLRRILL